MSIANSENIFCIILSGGFSSRMKKHKALLPYTGDENFLQHLVNTYISAGVQNIIIVMNAAINFNGINQPNTNLTFVKNFHPEKGRMYSLQLGMNTVSETGYCYIQNIDTPFVSKNLIIDLYNNKDKADYITPVFENKGGHPILVSPAVINEIKQTENYEFNLKELLEKFSRYRVQVEDNHCLININKPEDYKKLFS